MSGDRGDGDPLPLLLLLGAGVVVLLVAAAAALATEALGYLNETILRELTKDTP